MFFSGGGASSARTNDYGLQSDARRSENHPDSRFGRRAFTSGLRAAIFLAKLWMADVDGVVAQLVERLVRNEKVAGSIPVGSTSLMAGNPRDLKLHSAPAKREHVTEVSIGISFGA